MAREERTIGSPEHEVASAPLDREPALVNEPVVVPAELHQVVERRLPAARPVLEVMGIDEPSAIAAGESASAVASA